MRDVYVHTLRYHYGRGNRISRTMFPISYGPFKDEDSAWEWVRQTGFTHATRLMGIPAAENVEIPHHHSLPRKDQEFSSFLGIGKQPVSFEPLQNPGD